MFALRIRGAPAVRGSMRRVSTLSSNTHIKIFPSPTVPSSHLLTYLSTEPPNTDLAIGTCTAIPPTPKSFKENPRFLDILNDVLSEHAPQDAGLRAQAQALASPGGATIGPGGAFFSQQRRRETGYGGGGAGGASAQGGAGGGGVGGWVHLSDLRNPPDFGRIAWPEDILGSVEVNGNGEIIGNFQPSGTYRLVTNEGILGLSDFLREKLVARLNAMEKKA